MRHDISDRTGLSQKAEQYIPMKEIFRSKKIKIILLILGGIAALFLVFGLGVAVGYERAIFSSRFGENYYRNFYGLSRGLLGSMSGPMPVNAHGGVGTVMDVSSSSLSIRDSANNERSIAIFPDTVIRENDMTITSDLLKVGERIAVIGAPDEQGQIRARFIRVLAVESPEVSGTPEAAPGQ